MGSERDKVRGKNVLLGVIFAVKELKFYKKTGKTCIFVQKNLEVSSEFLTFAPILYNMNVRT